MYFTLRLRVWNSSMLCMECVNNKVSHIIGIFCLTSTILPREYWITMPEMEALHVSQLEWFPSPAHWCKVKTVFTCLTQVYVVKRSHGSSLHLSLSRDIKWSLMWAHVTRWPHVMFRSLPFSCVTLCHTWSHEVKRLQDYEVCEITWSQKVTGSQGSFCSIDFIVFVLLFVFAVFFCYVNFDSLMEWTTGCMVWYALREILG